MDVIQEAHWVFDREIAALEATRDSLGAEFETMVDLVLHCRGKVIITGMGKPGHIGAKLAATLASLGTPAFFMHPAEAMHGDLGMVTADDVVLLASYSGESDEVAAGAARDRLRHGGHYRQFKVLPCKRLPPPLFLSPLRGGVLHGPGSHL